ncbi:SCO2524 family protein [Cryptosporangium sp. NPDC051539]|uniref:SCO2524 family protein n=1 Tax=Cryptosporangium sp. NPDC051539 TaxID=3363962 RepID=UPI0037BAFBB4
MRVQPRRRLLEIWRAVAEVSVHDKGWVFGGDLPRNSIQDAEQLLCLLHPATEIACFRIDQPDQVPDDVRAAFKGIGGVTEAPRVLMRALTDYMETYRTADGVPDFSGGSYFHTAPGAGPTPEQLSQQVVDGYAISLKLSLATLKFLKGYREGRRRAQTEAVERLESLSSERLTGAMLGLLRSFSVLVFDSESEAGEAMQRAVGRVRTGPNRAIRELQQKLGDIKAGLMDLTIGSGQVIQEGDLDDVGRLFECGWSWGVIGNPPLFTEGGADARLQREGIAENRPNLYFTAAALHAIAELKPERIRMRRLLNDVQQQLAAALLVRAELTQRYWATLAKFQTGRLRRIEDIPWQTNDGAVSEYNSLLVMSMLGDDLDQQTVDRLSQVLDDLADRGRVTQRAGAEDASVLAIHAGGVEIPLVGSARLGPLLSRRTSDYSAMLLERTLLLSTKAHRPDLREELLSLVDAIWEHLVDRQISDGRHSGLWDRPESVFEELKHTSAVPSWSYTRRVVECLVHAAEIALGPPPRSDARAEQAQAGIAEAEHRLDQERMLGSDSSSAVWERLNQVQASIARAREVIVDYPATADALVGRALLELDSLATARGNVSGVSQS